MAVTAYKNRVTRVTRGTPVTSESNIPYTYSNLIELSSTHVLAVYNDAVNSLGKVIIGERVHALGIVWGTAVTFNSGTSNYIIPLRLSDTKFLIVYADNGNSDYGTAICGTVSGTVPSLGSENAFNSATTIPTGASLIDTDKVIITYANSTTNGQAIICSLTGTTISYGSAFTFKSADITTATPSKQSVVTLSTSQAVVCYFATNGIAQVLDISGTTITGNTEYNFNTGGTSYECMKALTSSTIVVGFIDTADTNAVKVNAGTISGTVITFGTETATSLTANAEPVIDVIDSTTFVMLNGTSALTIRAFTVSGTTVTGGTSIGSSTTHNATIKASTIPSLIICSDGHGIVLIHEGRGNYVTALFLRKGVTAQTGNCVVTFDWLNGLLELATAGAGEQVEISSIHYIDAYSNETNRAVQFFYDTDVDAFVEFTGSADTDAGNVSGSEASKYIPLPNSPIILGANQSLWVQLTGYSTSGSRGTSKASVFGLVRT